MWVNLTDRESIFLQALAITELMVRLNSANFLNSEYYKKSISFEENDLVFRQVLAKSGLGNPATLQMFLYMLLVMPKELFESKDDEYITGCKKKINPIISRMICEVSTTYEKENQSDKSTIDFYKHIRNAVAHSKCDYNGIDGIGYVTFSDMNMKDNNQHCEIKITTANVGSILVVLESHMKEYIIKQLEDREICN